MARGLYRVYLYFVTIALLVAAAVAIEILLSTLLRFTPLSGQYSSLPNGAELTQTMVLTLVTLFIVTALGALHYWLIRRDMASDPQPGTSGVRSFMINLAEAFATLTAVIAGGFALSQFNLNFQNDIASALSGALAAGGIVLALEWERRRAVATRGAALVFQRLRINGMGFILIFPLLGFLSQPVYHTETLIGQATGALQCMVTQPNGSYIGSSYPPCIGSQLIGEWAAALFVLSVWLLYLRASASDLRTLIRPVFMLFGFAAGVISLIVGVQRLAEYVMYVITSTASTRPDYINNYDAGPAIVFAAVTLGVIGWRLLEGAQESPLDQPTTRLTMRAIAGVIFAFPFWISAQMILNNLFIRLFPGGPTTDTNWHVALALAVAGIAYVPVALWLGASTRASGIKGPRRGFVLAMLAAGALIAAGSLATLIYSIVTAALNASISNWQDLARNASASLIVGLILGGIYLWISLIEGQFARAPRPEPSPEAAPVAGAALDDVLARFQQGSLSQAEAADRIRSLAREGALS